ncbi:hypothetical protein [Mycetocola sp. JXN-3]|uniref:hypothetical protein n=1 Tax=Mycetocola sp. JXN-3 TaxID=2116510 RepID=UPI00165CF041|nr:hypothetical protein [Mycetocola sp. JXN-3]
MSTQLSLNTEPAAQIPGMIDQSIAALPVSLRPGHLGVKRPSSDQACAGADLLAIAGDRGWTRRASEAIAAGYRGLLIVRPRPEDARELIASAASTPVVILTDWASNAAVAAHHAAAAELVAARAFVEISADLPPDEDLELALADQLALLRALGATVASPTLHEHGAGGFRVVGSLEQGGEFQLSGHLTASRPRGARVRLIGADTTVVLELPDPVIALRARVDIWTPGHHDDRAALWENAPRTALRRLVAAVHGGTTTSDLAHYEHGRRIQMGLSPAV